MAKAEVLLYRASRLHIPCMDPEHRDHQKGNMRMLNSAINSTLWKCDSCGMVAPMTNIIILVDIVEPGSVEELYVSDPRPGTWLGRPWRPGEKSVSLINSL